jgi:MerR family transcriptional regulator, thiopeptide resistance regulator
MDTFDIAEVARRTGLTSRALRFYEARGLLAPLRTFSGRRLYGAGELERVNQIIALKRAGLTLAQIDSLTRGRRLDLGALIAAQLAALEAKREELKQARSLLLAVQSRIDRGEPVDAATFCSLIANEELTMTADQWSTVTDRYFTPEEKAEFAAHPPAVDFNQADYSAKWTDLGKRVEAAIPLGPDRPEAQALYDEWQTLLAPFTKAATPTMMSGVTSFYEKMDEWQGDMANTPFNAATFRFIQEIGRGRRAGEAG